MSNYYQLLNYLSNLNLTCIKENLSAHLDEIVKQINHLAIPDLN